MSQDSDSSSPRWQRLLICGVLLLLTLAVYAAVLRNDFINLDDEGYVTKNPHVEKGLTAEGIGWAFMSAGYMSNWHPLTWISHMLDCEVYGLKPAGHHLTNVLFHAANTLLLFGVLRRMTGAVWRIGMVAALFAWHPTHVESVAWVAERKDVLSTFFWLLTMAAYVRYAEELKGGGNRWKVYYGLALILFALGLMAKPMLVTLPFVLLLLDYWPLGRSAECGVRNVESNGKKQTEPVPWKWLILEKTPFLLLAVGSSVVTVLAQKEAGSVASLSQVSITTRLATAMVSYCRYISKSVWPRHLSVFYPPVAGWPKSTMLVAAIFLGAVTVMVLRERRKSPHLGVGWFWFLGTLVPVIGLLQVGTQSLADRYTYVPMIGLLIMAVWEIDALTKDWPMRGIVLGVGSAVVLVACLTMTWSRVQDWRNSGTLFRQALNVAPVNNFMAHACLGQYLVDEGKNSEAIEHFQMALGTAPTLYTAQYGIGRALAAEGKWEEAAQYLSAAAQFYPNYPECHNQLGRALSKLGKTDEAMKHYLLALQLDPDLSEARLNLAELLAETGKFQEAAAAAAKAHDTAISAGRPDLAEAAQKRLEAYRSGKLYHE